MHRRRALHACHGAASIARTAGSPPPPPNTHKLHLSNVCLCLSACLCCHPPLLLLPQVPDVGRCDGAGRGSHAAARGGGPLCPPHTAHLAQELPAGEAEGGGQRWEEGRLSWLESQEPRLTVPLSASPLPHTHTHTHTHTHSPPLPLPTPPPPPLSHMYAGLGRGARDPQVPGELQRRPGAQCK